MELIIQMIANIGFLLLCAVVAIVVVECTHS